MMEHARKIESQVNAIKASTNSRSTKVLKMRTLISNGKERSMPEALIDEETGNKILGKREIQTAALKYCVDLLHNNQPDPEYREEFLIKNRKFDLALKEPTKEEDLQISREEFEKVVENLKQKSTSAYDFITKAGDSFKSLVFNMACKVWESEDIPKGWNLTTLVQIFKRGPRDKISSYRYIHMKNWFPRVFEGLVFNKVKPFLVEKFSKFQIGAKPGHQTKNTFLSLTAL